MRINFIIEVGVCKACRKVGVKAMGSSKKRSGGPLAKHRERLALLCYAMLYIRTLLAVKFGGPSKLQGLRHITWESPWTTKHILVCLETTSRSAQTTRILFHLAVLCDGMRCKAYGTFCYGIS